MYTLTLLDVARNKLLDTSIPANLSFVDKLSAVNYAVRHIARSGHDIVTIDDTKAEVQFDVTIPSVATNYYVVSDIIDIRTTQYASLIPMTSPKFDGQRMVVSTDELDDICSNLMFGFDNYAMVNPAKRSAVAILLVANIKPSLTTVDFSDLSLLTTYIDPVAIVTALKLHTVVV
jgi:hypothetical protein